MSDQVERESANWNAILRDDPDTAERWTEVVGHVASVVQATFGVTLSSNDVASLGLARVSALANDPSVLEGIEREARNLPIVKAALAAAEKRAAIEAGDESAIEELRRLRPADRIARARELGVVNGNDSVETPEVSEREQIAQLLTLRPSARIARGRKLGLI